MKRDQKADLQGARDSKPYVDKGCGQSLEHSDLRSQNAYSYGRCQHPDWVLGSGCLRCGDGEALWFFGVQGTGRFLS